jgi:hypothetical protein
MPRPVDISIQECHVQAVCAVCGQWIKFLNHKEKQRLLAELLGRPGKDRHADRNQCRITYV